MSSDLLLFLIVCVGLILLALSGVIFVLVHLHPLSQNEVTQLAGKRRQKEIRQYFSFERREFNANSEFKKRMNPDGEFHVLNENLVVFPAIAAALLKYKKHEWVMVAFESNRKINKIWINKGFDRTKVSLHLPPEYVSKIALSDKDTSVLIFHNHPNSDPAHYDCTRPSEQDMRFAKAYAQVLNREGRNLIEFVCERGRHYQYFQSVTDNFLPLAGFISGINAKNGASSLENLTLHLERIF